MWSQCAPTRQAFPKFTCKTCDTYPTLGTSSDTYLTSGTTSDTYLTSGTTSDPYLTSGTTSDTYLTSGTTSDTYLLVGFTLLKVRALMLYALGFYLTFDMTFGTYPTKLYLVPCLTYDI